MKLLACGFLGLVVAACSSSDDGGTSSGGTGTNNAASTGACAADNRKDVYADGLAKTAGDLQVRLSGANPAPPQKGTNDMTVELLDAGGHPVDGATITITPFMPDHGHGSAITPGVAASGGGKYAVSKVYLPMAGLWKLTFNISRPGAAATETAFQFCLDG